MTLFLGWLLWNYGLTPKQILEVWVSENISCRGLQFIFSSAIITQIHEKWLFSAIITQIHEKWLFWTLIILFDNSPPRNLVIPQKHACMDATPTMCSLESLEDLFQCSWKRGGEEVKVPKMSKNKSFFQILSKLLLEKVPLLQ